MHKGEAVQQEVFTSPISTEVNEIELLNDSTNTYNVRRQTAKAIAGLHRGNMTEAIKFIPPTAAANLRKNHVV